MRRKAVEFHELRYPANSTKVTRLSLKGVERLYAEVDSRRNRGGRAAFLRWFAKNRTDLESPLFKIFYAARQKQEQAKRTLFHNLRSISEHYTVSMGLLGGCLRFLNQSHKDCEDTIHLARRFLVEIAILDSTFADAYARELASIEFLQWVERNPRSEPPLAEYDKAFTLNAAWTKEKAADKYINEAKLQVKREELSSEHLNLIHEEKIRLSQPDHDLEFDHDKSAIIQEHIVEKMHLNEHPPLTLEGIKDTLNKWDDAGRHDGWQPLVMRRRHEFDRLNNILARAVAANPVEGDQFAEILWTDGEQYWKM